MDSQLFLKQSIYLDERTLSVIRESIPDVYADLHIQMRSTFGNTYEFTKKVISNLLNSKVTIKIQESDQCCYIVEKIKLLLSLTTITNVTPITLYREPGKILCRVGMVNDCYIVSVRWMYRDSIVSTLDKLTKFHSVGIEVRRMLVELGKLTGFSFGVSIEPAHFRICVLTEVQLYDLLSNLKAENMVQLSYVEMTVITDDNSTKKVLI